MIESYPLDKGRLYFLLGVNAVLLVYMLFDKKRSIELFKDRNKFRRSLIKTFLMGVLTLFVSSLLVALSFHSRDLRLIKAFLLFKDIGLKPGGLPYARTIGYQLIAFAILTLLVYRLRAKNIESIVEQTKYAINQNQELDRKVFTNARMSPEFSQVVEYVIPAILFLLLPLALIYYFVAFLISVNLEITNIVILGAVLSIIVLALDVLFYFILRNNWVKEIIVDKVSITLIGFYKKISAKWSEILSAEVDSWAFTKRVKVKTKKGDFFFPLTMKEKDKEYPKVDPLGEQWIYSDNIKRPLTAENCSLLTEIKKHLVR